MKTILVDAVDCFVSDTGVMFKAMYYLLETYPNKKIIVTNAAKEKFSTYGLDTAPYEVFTLEHNPEKTDPKYFQMLLEHIGVNATDVVYFEHNLAAIESAEKFGIASYFYDAEKKDLVALKTYLNGAL